MTDAPTLTLGGRAFVLHRRFTTRENVKAYPMVLRLDADDVIGRWRAVLEASVAALRAATAAEANGGVALADVGPTPSWEVSEDELGRMADLAFLVCHAADASLTEDEFDGLQASPRELLDALLEARFLTGMWRRPEPAAADAADASGDDAAGEADGAPAPLP